MLCMCVCMCDVKERETETQEGGGTVTFKKVSSSQKCFVDWLKEKVCIIKLG